MTKQEIINEIARINEVINKKFNDTFWSAIPSINRSKEELEGYLEDTKRYYWDKNFDSENESKFREDINKVYQSKEYIAKEIQEKIGDVIVDFGSGNAEIYTATEGKKNHNFSMIDIYFDYSKQQITFNVGSCGSFNNENDRCYQVAKYQLLAKILGDKEIQNFILAKFINYSDSLSILRRGYVINKKDYINLNIGNEIC